MLFSDESKFVMGFGDQGMRVWRRTHERHSPRCLKQMVKHPASIMVWGCVSSRGVGSLHFLPRGRNLNVDAYIDVLDAHLLPSIQKLHPDDPQAVIFQHNLAPAHSKKKTIKYLEEKASMFLNGLPTHLTST